jgi:hypothetical protein
MSALLAHGSPLMFRLTMSCSLRESAFVIVPHAVALVEYKSRSYLDISHKTTLCVSHGELFTLPRTESTSLQREGLRTEYPVYGTEAL